MNRLTVEQFVACLRWSRNGYLDREAVFANVNALIAPLVDTAVAGALLAAQNALQTTEEGDDCNSGCHDADRAAIKKITPADAQAALSRRDAVTRREANTYAANLAREHAPDFESVLRTLAEPPDTEPTYGAR